MERGVDMWTGVVSAVMLDRRVEEGAELWVETERMRSWIQAAEMSFFCRMAVLSLGFRVRSSDILRELRVKMLLLYIARSKLRWFEDLAGLVGDPGEDPEHGGEIIYLLWFGYTSGSHRSS